MPQPHTANAKAVTYVAAKSRAYGVALVLLASAGLLIAIARDDGNVGLLYFFAYPCAVLALVALVALALRKPARITIGSDYVIVAGARYALADITVGEQEYRQHGQATFRVFSLTTVEPDGRMREHEINAFAWPQFEELHRRLQSVAPSATGSSAS